MDNQPKRSWRAVATRVLVLLVVTGVVVYWSVHRGAPKKLPGAALSWPVLFYVERASALLAGVGVVLLVGWRALHGQFPIKFGNIEYREEARASAVTADSHEQRLRLIEDFLGLADIDDQPIESETR